MRRFVPVTLLALALVSHSCGIPETQDSSDLNITIDVPLEQEDAADVKHVLDKLQRLTSNSKTALSAREFFQILDLPDGFKTYEEQIINSRDQDINITCDNIGERCIGVSDGQKLNFTLSDISIPILGNPDVKLATRIQVEFKINSKASLAEVCRIEGIKVKSGFISQNVDGLIVSLTENDNPAIKEFKADVGIGGKYPSNDCRF